MNALSKNKFKVKYISLICTFIPLCLGTLIVIHAEPPRCEGYRYKQNSKKSLPTEPANWRKELQYAWRSKIFVRVVGAGKNNKQGRQIRSGASLSVYGEEEGM